MDSLVPRFKFQLVAGTDQLEQGWEFNWSPRVEGM